MENLTNDSGQKGDFRKPLTIFEAIKNTPLESPSANTEDSSKEAEKKPKERKFKDFLFPIGMLF